MDKEFKNLKEMLANVVNEYGNKTLYKMENKSISYDETFEKVNCLGTALIQMGLKNKKIAIISENRYEWEVAYFAIICGTGIVVPIDKSLTKIEIENIINRADVEAVFCSKKFEILLKNLKSKTNLKYIISFDINKNSDIQSFSQLIEEGKKLISLGDKSFTETKIENDQIVSIMFTSGTTNKSKAVMLSHKNICFSLINSSKVFNINNTDIVLAVLQLNHVLEGIFCMGLSICNGATRVFCNDIKQIVNYIKKYKITYMGGVPYIYENIFKQIDEIVAEKSHINMFMCGGANLNIELQKEYINKGIKLVQGYGLTEMSSVVSVDLRENIKLGSVGKVIPNLQLRLSNIDKNGVGEITLKGDSLFLGYYEDEEGTCKAVKDGWLYTGDLAKIDDEGYIFLQGRSKNMIVLKNGKKVFPEEIEMLLNKLEFVDESFVFSEKIGDNKQKICAEIVCNKFNKIVNNKFKLEQELLKEMKEINNILPPYKMIGEIFISEKPIAKTATGKIKRNEEIERLAYKTISYIILNPKLDDKFELMVEKVKTILSEQLGVNKNTINLESEVESNLYDESKFIVNIEKEFGIKILKENFKKLKKVKDIVEYLNNKNFRLTK